MAKSCHDDVIDAALNYIKTNATRLILCSAAPTTYAQANATYALAAIAIDDSDFTGPADGDVSGRKLTVAAQAGMPVTSTASATHAAIVDDSTSKLLYVTDTPSTALTASGTADAGSWTIEIRDPA